MFKRPFGKPAGVLLAAGCCILLGAQILLPSLAMRVVRSRLGGSAAVISTYVRALPAIKLLWGQADEVRARVRAYGADAPTLSKRLFEMRGVTNADISIQRLRAGRIALRNFSLQKRHNVILGDATIETSQLDTALPAGIETAGVTPQGGLMLKAVSSPDPQFVVIVSNGSVLAEPIGALGAFFSRTVFYDRRIRIDALRFENHGAHLLAQARGHLS